MHYPRDHLGMEVKVIGVQDRDHFAGSPVYPFIDRVVDTFIRTRNDRGQVGKGLRDLKGIIDRSAIDEDVFDLRIFLGPDAFEAIPDDF